MMPTCEMCIWPYVFHSFSENAFASRGPAKPMETPFWPLVSSMSDNAFAQENAFASHVPREQMHFPKHAFGLMFSQHFSLLFAALGAFSLRHGHYVRIGSFTHYVRRASRQLKRKASPHYVRLRFPSSAAASGTLVRHGQPTTVSTYSTTV